MQYAVTKLYPDVIARYKFINRGKHEFPEGFAEELQNQVNAMSNLANPFSLMNSRVGTMVNPVSLVPRSSFFSSFLLNNSFRSLRAAWLLYEP